MGLVTNITLFRKILQCLTQELKKVRHMSHQAEKGETYVSPGETPCLIDIIILKPANPCYTSLHGCHALSIILPFMMYHGPMFFN